MTVLFIFPHPDDETIFAGGTIARHIAKGDKVIWLCVSYGERGGETSRRSSRLFFILFYLIGIFRFLIHIQNLIIWWLSIFRKPDKTLAVIRKSEAEKVVEIYGIQPPHFLGIEDMRFKDNREKIIREVKNIIDLYKPQIIYTIHLNGITGHPDHVALGECVIEAVKNANLSQRPEVYGVTIPKNIVLKLRLPLFGIESDKIAKEIKLNESELKKKLLAINAYISQKYLWEIFLQKYPELIKREYFCKLN